MEWKKKKKPKDPNNLSKFLTDRFIVIQFQIFVSLALVVGESINYSWYEVEANVGTSITPIQVRKDIKNQTLPRQPEINVRETRKGIF